MDKTAKMTRTVKYELPYDDALVDTLKMSADVFRFWSDLAFEHRTSGKIDLHRLGYYVARDLFPSMQSMLILTVRDSVSEARKSARRRTGEKNPIVKAHPGRGLRYNDCCYTMFGGGEEVSLATIEGRKRYKITPAPGYEGRTCRSATLKIVKGRIFLHCQYETDTPPVKEWKDTDVLGVDRGIKRTSLLVRTTRSSTQNIFVTLKENIGT